MCTKPKTVLPTLSQYRTELGENTFKYATSFSWNNKQKDLKFSIRTVLLVGVTALQSQKLSFHQRLWWELLLGKLSAK